MGGLGNVVLLVLVVAAAAVLFLFACPYFAQIGHPGLCYVFYAVLIVTLLYARAGSARKRRLR
jgi:hypothetical protein